MSICQFYMNGKVFDKTKEIFKDLNSDMIWQKKRKRLITKRK